MNENNKFVLNQHQKSQPKKNMLSWLLLLPASAQMPESMLAELMRLLDGIRIDWKQLFLSYYNRQGPHHGCMSACQESSTERACNAMLEVLEVALVEAPSLNMDETQHLV